MYVLASVIVGNLKSNMDRFIAEKKHRRIFISSDLKSNMDRFIAVTIRVIPSDELFKIQYG